MGDISAEPSMEEILSSIKRIIAEEGDGPRTPARRPQRTPVALPQADPDEVLELSEPMPMRPAEPAPRAAEPVSYQPEPAQPRAAEPSPPRAVEPSPPSRAAEPAPAPRPREPDAAPAAPVSEPMVSHAAAVASRGSLDSLSRLVVKPEGAQSETTLEGLVRDMLRPMLSEWLDARLPEIVEAMVAREIERITGSR